MRRPPIFLPLLLLACGPPAAAVLPPTAPVIPGASATLFERLGGRELIDVLAADLLADLKASPSLAVRLTEGDPDERRLRLAEAICVASGGPCTTRPRATAEVAIPLSEAEEKALLEALHRGLDRFRVGPREQVQLRPIAEVALREALGA